MTTLINYDIAEKAAEETISKWAEYKQSHDYLTEIRLINIGDSSEFTGSKGRSIYLYTMVNGITVDDVINSNYNSLDKGTAIGNLLIKRIEKDIEKAINSSQIAGRLCDMKETVKIVIDNSVVITDTNIASLRYGVAVVY